MTINRLTFCAAFASCILLLIIPAAAQTPKLETAVANKSAPAGFSFTPFIALSTAYNDNIFLKAKSEDDTILRLNPGFVMTYHSKRTYFNLSYSQAADKYTRYSGLLNSWHDEQLGFLGYRRQFTDRFSAGINSSYMETFNPGQLAPAAGLVLTRTKSTYISVVPSLAYVLNENNAINIFYNRTRYNQNAGLITDVDNASLTFVHALSLRNSLEFQAQNFTYHTSDGSSASSNLITMGWTHAMSRQMSLVLSAGPRRTEGSTVPQVSAALRYNTDSFGYSITYVRSQAAIIGQSGVNDLQGLDVSFSYNPTPRLSIGLSPGYFHYYGTNLNTHGYHAGFYARYYLSPAWSINLNYGYSWQDGNVGTSTRPVVLRKNIVALALQWALPGPGDNYNHPRVPAGVSPVLTQ